MPEFTKYETASPFFPGQCFTCGTHEGPFYYLGEAPGYGTIMIHEHCVVELGRYEGLQDAKTVSKLRNKLEQTEGRVQELERQVEEERNRQMRVVPMSEVVKRLKPGSSNRKPKAKSDAVASGQAQ